MGTTTASAATSAGVRVTGTGRAPKWLRAIFLANLIAQTGIVLTGGLVRLTGSGLGCPTWPQCAPGSYIPTPTQATSWHKYVEFGNRSLTFILGVLAIASVVGALVWARRVRRAGGARRTALLWLAAVPLIGTFAQAVLGGITVLTGLNPVSVSSHFLISAILIALCVLLWVRSGEHADEPVTVLVKAPIHLLGRALVGVALCVLALGTLVTGSGPHSGDPDATDRLPFDPRSISWVHADLVLLFVGLTVGLILALTVTDAPRSARRWAWAILCVALLQGAIGYTQYFTGLPWLVVLLHLAGACTLWITVVMAYLRQRIRGPIQVR